MSGDCGRQNNLLGGRLNDCFLAANRSQLPTPVLTLLFTARGKVDIGYFFSRYHKRFAEHLHTIDYNQWMH